MSLGKRTKALRERLDKSQQALSVECGISISALQKIEQEKNINPTLDVLKALSKALNISIDALVK